MPKAPILHFPLHRWKLRHHTRYIVVTHFHADDYENFWQQVVKQFSPFFVLKRGQKARPDEPAITQSTSCACARDRDRDVLPASAVADLDVHSRRTALTTASSRRPITNRPRTASWNTFDTGSAAAASPSMCLPVSDDRQVLPLLTSSTTSFCTCSQTIHFRITTATLACTQS